MSLDTRIVYKLNIGVNPIYLCSHEDIIIPGISADDLFYGAIENPVSKTQSINPIQANSILGSISFTAVDVDSRLTERLNTEQRNGYGPRGKVVEEYRGTKGIEWADYELALTQQIHKKIRYAKKGKYTFTCREVELTAINDVFDPKITNLTQTISRTDITIPCVNSTDIDLIQHDAGFSDAPNENVLYVTIAEKGEVIRCTGKTTTTFTVDNEQSTISGAVAKYDTTIPVTDASNFGDSGYGYIDDGAGTVTEIRWLSKSGNTLQEVSGLANAHSSLDTIVYSKGRGAFDTIPQAYTVDATASREDSKPKIKEWIYYEMPAPAFLYLILVGKFYGTSNTVPSHHTLGIDPSWIDDESFTHIGQHVWKFSDFPTNNTPDSTGGFPVYGKGLTKVNAKQFYEKEINLLAGYYLVTKNTGKLGLKLLSHISPTTAPDMVVTSDDIATMDYVDYRMDLVYNRYNIKWNKESNLFTRSLTLDDTPSQDKWEIIRPLNLEFSLLHGTRHTDKTLSRQLNTWRSRHTGPPIEAVVTFKPNVRNIHLGKIIRVRVPDLRDFMVDSDDFDSLDRSFEIQQVTRNINGSITARIMGSSDIPEPLLIGGGASAVLNTAAYSGKGTELKSYLDTKYGTDVVATESGGVLYIEDDCEIDGNNDANNSGAHFYYLGDMQINTDVTLSYNRNFVPKIQGNVHFQSSTSRFKATSTGGLSGGSTDVDMNQLWWNPDPTYAGLGTSGYVGKTQAGGGININHSKYASNYRSYEAAVTEGYSDTLPPFNLVNDDGNSIDNLPTDMRNTSGGKGYPSGRVGIVFFDQVQGGNGASGVGSMCLICKSVTGNGKFIATGVSGNTGGTFSIFTPLVDGKNMNFATGTGAPSYPGNVMVLIDGNSPNIPDVTMVEAIAQQPLVTGAQLPSKNTGHAEIEENEVYSHYTGSNQENVAPNVFYVDYIPVAEVPAVDETGLAPSPTALTFSQAPNTPQSSYGVETVTITVTPPAGNNRYDYALIKIKKSTDSDAAYEDLPPASNSVQYAAAMVGTSFDVRAYSVSIDGQVSDDFIQDGFTVSNSLGSITEGAIAGWTINPTEISTGTGATARGISSGTVTFYAGSDTPASAPFNVTQAGVVTATNAIITGDITATTGTIGGWTAAASQLSAGDLYLDAGNTRIQCGNSATNYVRIQPTGITAVSSTLGTTISLPSDGSAPTFASGTINTTIFNITSSGILRTSDTVGDGSASSQGVLINDTGIKLFPTSASVPNIHLDATDGSITIYDWNHGSDPTKLDGGEIFASSITATQIATGTITANELAANSVNTSELVANSVTATEINVSTLSAISADLGSITAGAITSATYRTASSGKRIDINLTTANEMTFYGDRGDTTIEALATIGISSVGGDSTILKLGSVNNEHFSIYAQSKSNLITGATISAFQYNTVDDLTVAIEGRHVSGGIGVWANSVSGYGLKASIGSSGKANIELTPKSTATVPTYTANQGAVVCLNTIELWLNYNGSTGWAPIITGVEQDGDGSQLISGNSTWTPPQGFYIFSGPAGLRIDIKVDSSGSFKPSGTDASGSTMYCDGTNVRLRNSTGTSFTVYYRKYAVA